MANFDWKEYLILAQELIGKEGEKYVRASISKAYYAIFNILCQKVVFRDRKDKHQKLIEILKDVYNHQDIKDEYYYDLEEQDWIRMGIQLEEMRKERNAADYDAYTISKQRASSVLETIKSMFEILNK